MTVWSESKKLSLCGSEYLFLCRVIVIMILTLDSTLAEQPNYPFYVFSAGFFCVIRKHKIGRTV